MGAPEATEEAIALRTRDDGRTILVTVSGKLTKEDYHRFVPFLEQQVDEHEEIDILVELVDFHGWTAGAVWEDTKLAARHFSDIRRLAIVGDKKWEKGMAVFCKPFTAATIRYFDRGDRDEAEQWLGAGVAGAA